VQVCPNHGSGVQCPASPCGCGREGNVCVPKGKGVGGGGLGPSKGAGPSSVPESQGESQPMNEAAPTGDWGNGIMN